MVSVIRIQNEDEEALPKILRYGDIIRVNNAVLTVGGESSRILTCSEDCEYNVFSTDDSDPNGHRVINDFPYIHSNIIPTADFDRLNLLRFKLYSRIYYMYTSVVHEVALTLSRYNKHAFDTIVKVIGITKLTDTFCIFSVTDKHEEDHPEWRMYENCDGWDHVDRGDIVRLSEVKVRRNVDKYNVLDAARGFAVTKYIQHSMRARRLFTAVTKVVYPPPISTNIIDDSRRVKEATLHHVMNEVFGYHERFKTEFRLKVHLMDVIVHGDKNIANNTIQQYEKKKNYYRNTVPEYTPIGDSLTEDNLCYDFVLRVWDESLTEGDWRDITVNTLHLNPRFRQHTMSEGFFSMEAFNGNVKGNQKHSLNLIKEWNYLRTEGTQLILQIIGYRNNWWVTNTEVIEPMTPSQ